MSAEILRRAAALMRELATTAPVPVGPWESEFSDVIRTDVPFGDVGYLITECATVPEAKHIASWHPAVALDVAELLELIAANLHGDFPHGLDTYAEALARRYLGGDA